MKRVEILVKEWIAAMEEGKLSIQEIFEEAAKIRKKISNPNK